MKKRSARPATRRAGPPVIPTQRFGSTTRGVVSHASGTLDGGVAASIGLLTAFGLVMIYSTTAPLAMGHTIPPHFARHLAAIALSIAVAAAALRIPLEVWRKLALPLWGVSTLLLLITPLLGMDANGARRWLPLPGLGLSLQPAELAKLFTPLAVAALLARARRADGPVLGLCLGITILPMGLLLLQPDLGSAALLALLVGGLLFAGNVPLRRLGILAGGGALGIAAYVAVRPYAMARWKGFLEPWQNAQAEGFQLVQSFVAFGRGGTLGVGLGDGRQKLSYLPEAHTDFILSVVAEELGLVGVLVVLGAFAAFAWAGLRIAHRAPEPFAALTAFALTCFIAVPAAVNAAVVMGCLPTTGFTLPFVSFGSNSLVICALAVGMLLRIGAVESHAAPPRRRTRR